MMRRWMALVAGAFAIWIFLPRIVDRMMRPTTELDDLEIPQRDSYLDALFPTTLST